jgi:hypothetical protein
MMIPCSRSTLDATYSSLHCSHKVFASTVRGPKPSQHTRQVANLNCRHPMQKSYTHMSLSVSQMVTYVQTRASIHVCTTFHEIFLSHCNSLMVRSTTMKVRIYMYTSAKTTSWLPVNRTLQIFLTFSPSS